jgi:hypothetical protein
MGGTMRPLTNLAIAVSLVAGILSLSVRSAAADQFGFAVDATGNLSSVDLTTATAKLIGPTGQFLEGLAVSPQGALFGTDFLGICYQHSDCRRHRDHQLFAGPSARDGVGKPEYDRRGQ